MAAHGGIGPSVAAGRSAAGAAAWLAAPAHAAVAVDPVPWPGAVLVLALVAGAAAAAGALWMRRRSERELFDARQAARALEQLVGACRWRTDAGHRLESIVPAADAPAPARADAVRGQPLWDWLEVADATGGDLRGRLQSQGVVAGLAVRVGNADPSGPAGPAQWMLRAVPRLDADGRFAGHEGTLTPRTDDRAARLDHAALEALWPVLPGPAWLAVRDPATGAWPVRRRSDAAPAPTGPTPPADWGQLLATLPADLRRVVQELEAAAGGTAAQGRWQVQLARLDADGNEARLLVLWPAAVDDAAAAEQQSVSFAVSHDLRAPLRVVEGFTRILKEDYGRQLDRIGNDHLDRVLGACARMGHMIDALLALARLSNQPLVRQPVDLSQLAGLVVDDLRRHSPGPPADVTIEPGLEVQGDPTLLRMVLENLLGNAWKYSARCERRRIALERTTHEGREAFVVRDNGAGFDMRFADRLFGMFQRLHSASDFPGTGVGLASVRRIVARHGGRIWAEGEVGKGASFYFTLGG